MAPPEQHAEQDRRLTELVDNAMQQLREEFLARLAETGSRLTREAARGGGREGSAAVNSLHGAVAALDRGRNQAEILGALLERSTHFASRALLLLTGEGALEGWASSGFSASSEAVGALALACDEGSPWARAADGEGTVELDAESCAATCAALDGSRPAGGVLIPMVLRDRVAATLYADRLSSDDPLDRSALQLLTHMTALSIETLPLRERHSTATLRLATAEPAVEAPAEPAVEAPAAEPAAPPPVEEPVEELLEEPVEEPLEEPVEEPAAPPAAAPPPAAEPEPWRLPAAEAPPAEPPAAAPEPAAVEPVEPLQGAEEAGFAVEPELAPEPEPAAAPPPATRALDPGTAPIEPPVVPPAAPPEMTPPAPASPPVSGTQILPPDDLKGPGWAFTSSAVGATDGGEDTQHEEARRLARLLVTEIKLYNEEAVEEGLRRRNIYDVLRDDIDRSRQIFEERISEEIRSENDYFQAELVRILAGGDASVLGI